MVIQTLPEELDCPLVIKASIYEDIDGICKKVLLKIQREMLTMHFISGIEHQCETESKYLHCTFMCNLVHGQYLLRW